MCKARRAGASGPAGGRPTEETLEHEHEHEHGARRLKVALDATPLLGARTGVGAFCAGALGALCERFDADVLAFAVSWRRRRGIVHHLPAGVKAVEQPMPARPLQRAWRSSQWPPVEWWTGPLDVVHGTNFVVPPSRRAARVVTVHDLTTLRFPQLCDRSTLVFPALVARAVAGGAWVHVPSDFVAGEVIDLLGVEASRVRTVRHGIPPLDPHLDGAPQGAAPGDRAAPGERQGADLSRSGSGRYVLALGTVEPRKDLPSLVRAFDALADRHPDVSLVVAGPDGWGTEAFEEALEAAGCRERVVRLGWVSARDRAELLRGATVFAYPSLYEGFGFPPLEAMLAGVPVVATTAGALPEVTRDGARLVTPGDVGALAEALDDVLSDGALRAEMVAAGRRRAGELSWASCASGLMALYRDASEA